MPAWTRAIRRLRRRAVVSSALDRFARLTVPVAFLALAFVGAAEISPWPRYLAPYFALALAVALAAGLAYGWAIGARSEGYLAKWIDLESKLEDRLASAVEWSRDQNPLDPFRKRCVEQLELELNAGRRKLVLPRTRPKRLGWTLLALGI